MLKYSVSFFAFMLGFLANVSGAMARDINNEVISGKSADVGGALKINDGQWHITNSEFSNNSTIKGGGGALYIQVNPGYNADIIIDNTLFKDNVSAGIGGAVFMIRNNADMYVTNSQFINNIATKGGGAFNSGVNEGCEGRVIYRDNLFQGNKSLMVSDGNSDLDGGAIRLDSGHIIFEGVNTFVDNTNPEGKNDIFLKNGTIDVKGKLILDGGITEFNTGNTATTVWDGGEIVANNATGETVLGNQVINNGTITVEKERAVRFVTDSLNNNMLNNDGRVNVAGGTLTLNKGINGTGITEIATEAGMVAAGDKINIENSLENKGTLTVLTGKALDLLKGVINKGSLINNGTLETVEALANDGIITNTEILNLLNGGSNSGVIANAGTLSVNGGVLTLNTGISGVGVTKIAAGARVEAVGDEVDIENSVENNGVLSVLTDKVLNLLNGGTNDGALNNAGTLNVKGGTLTLGTGINSSRGTTKIANGAEVVAAGKGVVVGNTVINNGKLTVAENASFELNKEVTNDGLLTNDGMLIVGGVFNNSGTVTNNAGKVLTLNNGGTNDGVLNNVGTLNVNDGVLTLNTGISGEGNLRVAANGSILANADTVTVENTVRNGGLLKVLAGKILNLLNGGSSSATIENNGTLNIQGGNLILSGTISGTDEGKLNIAQGANLTVTGDNTQIANSVDNQGTIKVESDKKLTLLKAIVNKGTINNAGELKLAAGLVNEGLFTNLGTTDVAGGVLALYGDIAGSGRLLLQKETGVNLAKDSVVIENQVESATEINIAEAQTLTIKNNFINSGAFKNDGTFTASNFTNSNLLYNNGKMKINDLSLLSGSNMYLGVSSLTEVGDYIADNALLTIDMRVIDKDTPIQNGLLKIGGNVSGTTNVIVNALSPTVYAGASTLFVDAPNDVTGTDGSFVVARVIGSPYMWDSKCVAGTTNGNKWYLSIAEDKPNDEYEGEIPDITDPDNPDKPVDPDNPDNPDKPVEPDNPDKPVDPDNPDKPVDPDNPDKPVDPDNPDKPVDPDNPDKPVDPDNPDKPVDPDNPDKPVEPDNPDKPVDPDNPDKPVEPDNPDKPVDPDNPDKPVDPDNPDKPVDPDNPDKPVDPDNPDKPVDPDNPDKPVDPDNPDKPVDPDNPDKPSKPLYAPEVGAYVGLTSAIIEQSRGIAQDVWNGLAFEKSALCYQESCGLAEIVPHKRAWSHISSRSVKLDAPTDMEAKIWGFTAGADFYRDFSQRAGVFGFYRNGDYDLSGRGKYNSRLGADISNDSYAGGLYYQLDDSIRKFLSTVYLGRQNIDIRTDDAIVKAGTDATQFGASVESGYRYYLLDELTLEPGVGLSYMMANIDGFMDNVGKRVSYDKLHYWELEMGVKAEYTSCEDGLTRKLYIRPSVVQTFSRGDEAHVSGVADPIHTYKNQTLGRVRLGGQFGLTQELSGYVDFGYTFGKDYEAYVAQFGMSYNF